MTALTITGKWSTKRKSVDIDHVFLEDLEGIPDGTDVCAVITTDRDPDQLKAYWATLGDIIKAGCWDGDKDSLDDYTRIGVGFGKWRPLSDGRAVFIPDSIALSKCDGRKFRRFMWAAERLWAERLGVDVEATKREASASQRRAA